MGKGVRGIPRGLCGIVISTFMNAKITRASARRARLRLTVSILTTHGYAILGFSVIQPLLSNPLKFTIYQIAGAGLGLAVQALAVYIVPYGEPS